MPPTVLTSSFSLFGNNCTRSIFSIFFPDQVEVAYLRAARAGILEKVLNFLNEDGDIHTCNAVSERADRYCIEFATCNIACIDLYQNNIGQFFQEYCIYFVKISFPQLSVCALFADWVVEIFQADSTWEISYIIKLLGIYDSQIPRGY